MTGVSTTEPQPSPAPPPPPPPPPLPYARPPAPGEEPPVSRLAWASIIAAPLACPCVLAPLLTRLDFLANGGWFPIQMAAMAAATVLPVVALVRMRRSRGARGGFGIAATSLGVALLWWVAVVALFFLMRGMTMPAPG